MISFLHTCLDMPTGLPSPRSCVLLPFGHPWIALPGWIAYHVGFPTYIPLVSVLTQFPHTLGRLGCLVADVGWIACCWILEQT